MERLQKVLANAGVASRRAAEKLIVEGRVTVNGHSVTRLGTRVDPDNDAIQVDGKRIPGVSSTPVYLILNKPQGYITTLSDPEGRPTVLDLLGKVKGRVYPVGRLDYHSEGLLLFTNDGEMARALMHPRTAVPKTYLVKVQGRPSEESLARLRNGVVLDGRRSLPAKVHLVRHTPNSWVEITVVEGRKHQVKRMCMVIGHRVMKLRRIRYAGLRLGDLRSGRHRLLTPREVDGLQRTLRGRAERP